jgi:threonine dehydrogenase-like Zn-dependent dehydrogenase
MDTMQAAVYHGPHDLRVESVPMPAIGPDEVLLHVLRANICGTDLRILHGGHRKYPPGTTRIPGHEVVGEVAAVGRPGRAYARPPLYVAPNMGRGGVVRPSAATITSTPIRAFGITLDGALPNIRVPAAIRR